MLLTHARTVRELLICSAYLIVDSKVPSSEQCYQTAHVYISVRPVRHQYVRHIVQYVMVCAKGHGFDYRLGDRLSWLRYLGVVNCAYLSAYPNTNSNRYRYCWRLSIFFVTRVVRFFYILYYKCINLNIMSKILLTIIKQQSKWTVNLHRPILVCLKSSASNSTNMSRA